MKSYTAIIHIMPHKVLLDPAGKATLQAVQKLGFDSVIDTRIGKRVEISLKAQNENLAQKMAEQIAKELLVNPIIESFQVEIQPS